MKKLIIAGTALASVMAFSATASAESLGEQGQIAIMSDVSLDFGYKVHTEKDENGNKLDNVVAFQIRPALDYFVIDGLSLGGLLGFGYGGRGEASTIAFEIGPRVGYAIGDH